MSQISLARLPKADRVLVGLDQTPDTRSETRVPKVVSDLEGLDQTAEAMVEVEYRFDNENVGCSFWHLSNLTEGRPFNGREESSLDMVGCSLKLF